MFTSQHQLLTRELWVEPFTAVAAERDVEGDVILADMGDGLPFRPGTFDGCIRYVHMLPHVLLPLLLLHIFL